MSQKQKPLKYKEILEDAFEFDADALKHNANGEFSRVQRKQLETATETNLILLGIGVIGIILSLVFTAFFPTLALIVMLLALVIGAALVIRWWTLRKDLFENRIESIEGRIHLDVAGSSQSAPTYLVQIGDKKFTLDKKKFLALKNGDPYRFYYLPTAERILSLEWLYSDESRDPAIDENLQDSANELVDDESTPFVDDFGAESRRSERL
jgi:hypothetical protein